VAYLDLTGSGSETCAHVLQNGRITILFMNIEEGNPGILRLYGQATVVLPNEADVALLDLFPETLRADFGFRAILRVRLERVSDSCGYSLPVFAHVRNRTTLAEYTAAKGQEGMVEYRVLKNSFSIDGAPSLSLLTEPRVCPQPTDGYIYGMRTDQASWRCVPPITSLWRRGKFLSTIWPLRFLGALSLGFLLGVGWQRRQGLSHITIMTL
jgi:hypothetical protein